MDLIDLAYGPLNLYWHTRLDTADKCSPGSLEIVGQVVQKSLQVLENLRFRINKSLRFFRDCARKKWLRRT